MENKTQIYKEVEKKVNELEIAQVRLEETLEELEATKQEGQQELVKLNEEIAQLEETKDISTDASVVREAIKNIKELKNEVELQQGFNKAMDNKAKKVLFTDAEEFYKLFNQVKMLYKPMLKAYIADASLNSITEDIEKIQAITRKVNSLFGQTKAFLIDAGVIEPAQARVRFEQGTSVHMNQRGLDIEELRDLQKVFTDMDRKLFQPVR
ncbi:hypothetical protein JF544_05625 [Halobacillus kuroshimensis]|uniref:Uncharacterized protein n=1 Tax=Halobacillus kuroshimensis TaxID=302481 RepID=A0ABS3DTN4_9BACI|nr:hypothetical protein [Halobacillus kuroshimensis]MBN8234717.1 hypothetical protein [Halobacillus kuroshimensis]